MQISNDHMETVSDDWNDLDDRDDGRLFRNHHFYTSNREYIRPGWR